MVLYKYDWESDIAIFRSVFNHDKKRPRSVKLSDLAIPPERPHDTRHDSENIRVWSVAYSQEDQDLIREHEKREYSHDYPTEVEEGVREDLIKNPEINTLFKLLLKIYAHDLKCVSKPPLSSRALDALDVRTLGNLIFLTLFL